MTIGPIQVELTVNGRAESAWMPPNTTLLNALRDHFGTTDVKYGCGEGVCGTCTVRVDGDVVNACNLFACQVDGAQIDTMAGLAREGELHDLQRSFLEHGGSQCGFCTPGMVMTALDHVERGGSADRDEVRQALSGNICRCTGYVKIVDAVAAYIESRGNEDQS